MECSKNFRFEFFSALHRLSNSDTRLKDELSHFLQVKRWCFQDKQNLLQKLAELVIYQDFSPFIVDYCKPILLEIVERAAQIVHQRSFQRNPCFEEFCYFLSTLLEHSHLKDFIYRFLKSSSLLSVFSEEDGKLDQSDERILRVLKTGYNLLCFDFQTFHNLWDWSPVLKLSRHQDAKVRWFAVRIIAMLMEMSDKAELNLSEKCFTAVEINSSLMEDWFGKGLVRGFPIVNDFMEVDIISPDGSFFSDEDFLGNYTTICGVVLPRLGEASSPSDRSLVMVPKAINNLHSLVLSIASGCGVLLEGIIGCGKTTLVEYVARTTGRSGPPEFIKIQLGDQTDSKSLLGTYICTDTPGEFVWQPGPLLQAVQEGHWILLEDIDQAPMDVISVLIPLLESRTLSVPAHGNSVKASPGFQLFATQRSYTSQGGGSYQIASANSAILDKLWTRVQIEPLSKGELVDVLSVKYPDLGAVAGKLVDIFCLLSADSRLISDLDISNSALPHDKRLCSTRDFMKWCSRIAITACGTPSQLDQNNVFLEAQDCFTAPLPKAEDRRLLDIAIGAKLGLTTEKVEFFSSIYKPSVHVSPLSLTVGRISLKRNAKEKTRVPWNRNSIPRYSHTRHSSVLLEKLAACIRNKEPVLLVGETGTGKTATVQYLAAQCLTTLKVVNMSQQSDSSDLLGGYKPVEMKQIVAPVREKFEVLFCKTFSRKQNVKFLGHVQKCYAEGTWEIVFKLMMHAQKNALERTMKDDRIRHLRLEWQTLHQEIKQLRKQQKNAESALAFRFMEGSLVQALRNGDWVLLDEINLATPETLECLCGLLESSSGSLVLVERGDVTPTVRHDDFRLFACMNPATDVGKKDLPPGIRNRFTEIFVNELEDTADLNTLVMDYLKGLSPNATIVDGIVRFYLTVKHEAKEKLTDGTGHKPHYSLRTLCRALQYAATNPHQSALRSIYEGFCLSFLTQLDRSSHPNVQSLIQRFLLGHVNPSSILNQPLLIPRGGGEFCNFEGFWIARGSKEPFVSPKYVLTLSVKANLKDLSRVVSARYLPVLIQGETSVGKTSLIQWLAKASGNHCVRINNHEHTDIQEYLGCYTSDENGKLVFKEGVLVDAMRKGYWIILDELNLAPSDVLEALNRLLDDNRELFIPETQETIAAHPMFMLFATQNPPGHYGGRKVLSRAFRNRFVELHFDELPSQELELILHQRCSLPSSYAKKLVAIMLDLQARRRSTNVFAGKQGFITLRDLFRWAERYSKTPDEPSGGFRDWDRHIAEDGYMLLAGRCRNPSECAVIQEVIELHMKRKINLDLLFGDPSSVQLSPGISELITQVTTSSLEGFEHIVWTHSMRRLAILAGRALQFGEPVLLVGETGCGKTTICQLLAALWNQKLFAVNCHMHSESSDFLGGLRPVRNRGHDEQGEQLSKLFEWCDGPLVLAMKDGAVLLVDEISLADDSVLERLNSVLEPERTLLLAEKGGGALDAREDVNILVAHDNFRIIGTMNPGGDFGKKELSPALRNRFTEIWCPPSKSREDLVQIIEHNIKSDISFESASPGSSGIGEAIMNFIEWLHSTEFGKKFVVSIRDLLSWVNFINTCSNGSTTFEDNYHGSDKILLSPSSAYVHGACLVFLDALGSTSSPSSSSVCAVKDAYQTCLEFLRRQVHVEGNETSLESEEFDTTNDRGNFFGVHPFYIKIGPLPISGKLSRSYAFNSPTTSQNAQRLLRALQLSRPILLEGSPGVGKTSLVGAIAKASGHELIRINLSEQTDVTDLFGADLPVEGGEAGQFVWRDGPLLKALKAGHWVVLDELNLASQSVLEGLNACLDHRAEAYIPELGMAFRVQKGQTRLFACQNPLNQGGGRKGLPKSFLNRFTQVYVEPLSKSDLLFITGALYPRIDASVVDKMVTFNMKVHQDTVVEGKWGRKGSPWEFNLRDVFRWCDLLIKHQSPGFWNPGQFVRLIYSDRMRTVKDKQMVVELFQSVFDSAEQMEDIRNIRPSFHITPFHVQVGHSWLPRCATVDQASITARPLQVLHQCLPTMESLMKCVEMNWMTVLVGSRSCGKTSLVHLLAQLTGNKLEVMAMNSAMDTTELLGGFEQADLNRQWGEIVTLTKDLVLSVIRETLLTGVAIPRCLQEMSLLYKLWIGCSGQEKEGDDDSSRDLLSLGEMDAFLSLLESVENICRSIGFNSFSAESLRDMLQSLRQRLIANGDSSHCSGQFEWVDGQLVEALKSGHWLLIDNVNFCSPSVLDRLNALLEPGGVLTIDERGVIDGEIPSIKPHPNFRLILAMDPRYGEISRAMRNRGVEIFMLGEEDDQSFDKYDHEMLLHGLGLHDSSLCSSVVNFHTDLRKTLRGSILDTLRAASLTSDLILRGSRKKDAFVTALKQVYVRNQVSDRNKQIAEELVTRHTFIMENVENETSIPSIAALFPSAKDYHTNSIMAMITLHSLPALQVLRSPQTGAQLEFATLVFLERSSVHDWKLRLDYLQSLAQSALGSAPCQLQNRVASIVKGFVHSFGALFSSQLMEKLNNIRSDVTSAQFDSQMLDHFPVDLRMNKDLFDQLNQTQSNASLLDAISGIVNRLSLLELEARRCYVEGDSCHPVNSPSRNVLQLSSAYQSGQVQMERLPHPVVVHLLPFFKLFSSFLEFCISQESQFTDTHYWTVIDGLVWRDRLWRTCQKLSRENFTMSSLSLHWTWVVQHTLNSVPVAFGLLDYRQLPSELVTVINQLNGILATGSRMAEVFYKILTAYGHPPPFRSKLSSEIWERLQHLCQRIDRFPNKLQVGANEERLRDLQRKLVSVFRDVMENRLQGGHLQCVSVIQNLEETVDSMLMQARDTVLHDAESCEIARPPTDNSTTSEAEMGKTLLALFESICSLQEHTVLATLMSGLANQMACRATFRQIEKVEEQMQSLTAYQLNKTSRKPETTARYQYLQAIFPQGDNLSENFGAIFKPVESDLLCNYWLLKSSSLWSQNVQGQLALVPEQGLNCQDASVHSVLGGARSLLASSASKKLRVEAQGPLQSLTIDSYHDNIKQLQVLCSHFWVNGDVLDNYSDVDRETSIRLFVAKLSHVVLSIKEILPPRDQKMLLSLVEKLLDSREDDEGLASAINDLRKAVLGAVISFKQATGNEKHADLICSLLKNCLEELSLVIKNTPSGAAEFLWDSTRLGYLWVNLGLAQSIILSPVGPVDPVEKDCVELQYVTEQIQRIEDELKVRFYAEEMWTGLTTDPEKFELLLSQESWNETQLTSNPFRVKRLFTKLQELRARVKSLEKNVAFRPAVSQFDAILNEVKHFTHSVGDARSVIVLAESMRDVAADLFTSLKDGTTEHVSSSRVHSAVNKAKAWHISASRFVEHMVKDYPLYCDLLAPFVAGISQAIYGIALMSARLSVLLQQHTFVAQLPAATCLKLTTPDEKMISSLCQCPNPRSSSPLDLAISLTSYSMQTIIQALVKCFCVDDQASSISALLSYRVVRLSLLNVQIHSLQHGFLDQKTHQALNSILVIFLDKWRIYQEQERQREEEEGSLFKYKDRSHGSNISEEEENELAVRRAFPSFDSEFKDIMVQDDLNDSGEQPQLENTPPESLLASNAELFMAAMKDYSEVRSVHEEMFCRLLSSRDLSFGVKDSCLNSSVDALYRQAFEWGYQTAGMLKAITPWLATEAQLSCSHILQSCILQGNFEMESGSTLPFNFLNTVGNAKGGRPFNIYHDSNIQEAVKVKPVLQDFSARVQELLAEWPRNPNLVQLMVVIERILSFPVTSPLMRLLTGLEVLLKKSQDWESNAAKHVSLREHLDKVTQLIIQWRKMELKCWSSLLDVTSDEAAARSSHWWFHIYNLLQQFRTGSAENACTENVPEINELVEAFQKFIESSTLGEFSSRVKMLFVFYKEMCSEEESNQDLKAKVSDVLWNVHSYYKQFVPRVEQSLSEGREPIEKELKGFAKIAKWNDSNFWAMKQAADKSHYTLHKFVRKYESCLNEPVQKILMNAKSVLASPEDKTQTEFNEQIILQTEWFISPDHIKGYYDEDLQLASSCEALGLSLPTGHSRLPKLFQKMRKLSSQLLNERGYMQRVLSLDDFTGEVISRSKELQALDVMNQPKEKRKELGKHIQQRKRKSLSDLFKILSSIGVSYRKGLNLERQSTSKESMTLAAVDEEAVVNSVSLLSDRPSDLIHKVSQLAHGCCHHFFKALARSAAFDVVIVTPSKELGIGEIDRCKGCTSHLLHVCYEQRKVISRFSRDIRNASVCLQQLSQMVDFTSDGQRSRCSFLPPQAELQRRTVRVMDLLTCASQVLQQVFTLLRCCPNDANESSPPEWSPFPQSMLSSVALSSSSDDVITDLAQKLKEATNEVQRLAKDIRPYAAVSDHVLHNSRRDDTTAFVTSWRQFDKVEKAFFKLQSISEMIAGMLPRFDSKCCHIDQGFGGALVDLKNKVLKECDDFFTWREDTLGGGDEHEFWNTEESHEQAMATVDSFFGDVDSLNTSLLLATQRLAKIAENSGNENTEVGETADEEPDFENFQLQDKHLTTLLHQKLLEEINSLHMANVSKGTESLLSRLRTLADNTACGSFLRKSADLCAQMLGTSIPFLHQFLSLSQHLLVNLLASHRATSKLLSVLLSIFTDLASKGFCLPPEIEEGEGEGPTEFEDIEEGGLGEGEGIKDVSDQIESEDQLDDTKREGQEQDKKEEDQEQIPDEENGIEMSENFDGALHDLEAGEDQDDEKSEDENEEENELDKQMGEVDGQEAEKLDEKMWGDSDEEDEQEEKEMKEEKGTGAEAESQSQLVAKEDNKGAAEESKDKTDQSQDPEVEEEQTQPNEADYNEEGNLDDEGATGEQEQQQSQNPEEVEDLDLPDDLQLDGDGKEDNDGQEEMETDDFEGDKGKEENAEDEMPADDDQLCGDKDKSDQQAMADEEDTEEKDESEKHRDGEMPNDEKEDDSSDGDQEDWRTKSDTKSQENVQAVEDSRQGDGSGEQSEETAGQSESTEGSEERGLGQADAADSEGHCGKSSTAQVPVNGNQQLKESRQRKQMNRARSDRALGSMDETTHKRLKTVDDSETVSNAEANEAKRQDLFQHIQNDVSTNYDAQILDSATADQAEEQEKGNFPDMDSEADKDEDDDYEMQSAFLEDKDEFPTPERPQRSRMLPPVKPRSTEDTEQEEEAETENREEDMETNNPEEITADRLLSTYHSSEIALAFERMDISSLDPDKLRSVLEHQLAHWSNLDRGTIEEQQVAQEAWRKYEFLTAGLSQELCEQLRLVLEPALASKLKGDYRSGKRLNMRKVIPYIASQFRKDKIWLRRTKPSKRQYQIMLAVDDSSSMKDNHSKQLAFESLAVISNALTRLEAGDLGICSFGETVQLLHPFHEPFSDQSGAKILQQFTFDQKKTKIAQLLDTCTSLMLSAQRSQLSPRIRRDTSQLLLIVSDGRGIFLEGVETVQKAVRFARQANIFMVFVILDNPANKDSILDIRFPIFRPSKPPEIKSYMEQFPFPFYIILRDINALPQILSDALRQWFELVASME
ncbi:midasin-like [Acropora palmata]|uniref:midasin-like n=1 Tax=Acropora palmata TaxID=6131 RepID=UPI003D9FBFD8